MFYDNYGLEEYDEWRSRLSAEVSIETGKDEIDTLIRETSVTDILDTIEDVNIDENLTEEEYSNMAISCIKYIKDNSGSIKEKYIQQVVEPIVSDYINAWLLTRKYLS
jgi:hypothetical protein